jgi:diguanylate cyclase (GGDEF)-like protein
MFIVTAVVISIVTYSFNTGYDMTSKYAPLVDATMEIKIETTTARLWFEEIMHGDKDKDIDAVNINIKNAIWYANAIIKGGTNQHGRYLPVNNKKIESQINIVLEKLKKFQDIVNQRYSHYIESGTDIDYDKKHDLIFREFLIEAGSVEAELQTIIASELQTYKTTYYLLIVAFIVLIFIASLILYRYEKRIRDLTTIDPLTQLSNRLYIEGMFENEIKRAQRYEKTFAVIFADIDYFKSVNDTYGHETGDSVLKEFANILKSDIRSLDTIARWGGEEFLILCPETNIESAKILAEKLRKNIESYKFKTIGNKTCSFGVSEYTAEDITAKSTIKRADKALYMAKKSGRNRVVSK